MLARQQTLAVKGSGSKAMYPKTTASAESSIGVGRRDFKTNFSLLKSLESLQKYIKHKAEIIYITPDGDYCEVRNTRDFNPVFS